MSIYEFNARSQDDKASFVWSDCIFLASYAESATHVNILYHAPGQGLTKADFFVEVSYHVGDNCIDHIRSFRTNRLLEPYLEKVKLAGL